MIVIKNSQKAVAIDTKQLKKDAQLLLNAVGYPDFDLGIHITTNKKIQEYNREFRDKDAPTDVLSFPYHAELKAGELIVVEFDEDKNIGDLIIAPQYVVDDLPRWDMTFEERLRVLLAHGICHLLGYDHITDEDYAVMKEQEDKLLALLEQT